MKSRLPRCAGLDGDPEANVAAFVARGRASGNFGAGLDFDAGNWEVTDHVRRRSGVPARRGRLHLNFERPPCRGGAADQAPSPMGLFVRAYVAQLPGRNGFQGMLMLALVGRLVSEAMAARGVMRVSDCTPAVFDLAMVLAEAHGGATYVRSLGCSARGLAAFLNANGMVDASLAGWRPAAAAPKPADRIDEAFAARSARLLPSDAFLEALADAYVLAEDPADVVVTRLGVLLAASPDRINELLAIGVHPEVEGTFNGVSRLALRWTGSKGFPDGIKWIPSALADTVREALADLREVTEEGRKIKQWYDGKPGSLYLPPSLEHLRGKARLTLEEVGALLGREPGCGVHGLIRRAGLELLPSVGILTGAANNLSFAVLEGYMLRGMHDRMRDCGGPATDPLLVVPLGTFNGRKRSVCPCTFEPVRYVHVANAFMPGPGHATVFQRLGLDAAGVIGAGTHALRHWLDTLAKRGGLSETDIAVWSGRVDPRQNRHYDHTTAEERRRLAARGNAKSGRTTSPLARRRKPGKPRGS